jgi:TPR repeat protein
LNPFNADNYNCIAHIIWKKKDLESAIKYYHKALEIDPRNKTSLRSLSMIVRSKDFTNFEEKKESSKTSLDFGKKAIEADLKDSNSWCKIKINVL